MEKKLPTSISNTTKRIQLEQKTNDFIQWINNELRIAFESEGITFDLTTIEKYSDIKVLSQFIETEKNKQLKAGFIPVETKQSIIQSFDAVLERLTPAIEKYNTSKKAYPIRLEQSGKTIQFNELELNAWLDNQTTYIFDSVDIAYYNLLLEVESVISKVQAYEKANNIPSYVAESVRTLVSMVENIPSKTHAYGFINDWSNNNSIDEKIATLRGFIL